MGYPMAGYLSEAGHRVTVFNRTAEKAERWCGQYQGRRATTPAEAVKDADAVFTCLGDDPDVREVVLAPGGVLVDVIFDRVLALEDLDHNVDRLGRARARYRFGRRGARYRLPRCAGFRRAGGR